MGTIKDYKVKKKRASIVSFVVLGILMYLLLSISKTEDMKIASCVLTSVVWALSYVEYRTISIKVEILEELEKNSKNSL